MEHREVLIWLPLAGLVALLALAALIDLRERRIPNWLTGGVAALYPLYVLASPMPVASLGVALAVAAAVFVFGFVLFARQLIGGGDVKLIAAVTLWTGLDHLALFALITSLAGGGLALGSLWYQRWRGVIDAHMAALGWSLAPTGRMRHAESTSSEASDGAASSAIEQAPLTLPYGIAIAAGGLAVVAQLIEH
jgi:Flp pilus assembly protein protease CpaA